MNYKALFAITGTAVATAYGALTPWFAPLFDFQLISDYFQPELNRFAGLAGTIGFMLAFVMWRKISMARKISRIQWFLIATASLVAICLVLKLTVGDLWAPGQIMTTIVRWIWQILYVSIFFVFGLALSMLAMLVYPTEPTQDTAS